MRCEVSLLNGAGGRGAIEEFINPARGFVEVFGCEMGIAFHHLDLRVPKNLLDRVKRNAARDHHGGVVMPQIVKT
jgi:hypothetical protein